MVFQKVLEGLGLLVCMYFCGLVISSSMGDAFNSLGIMMTGMPVVFGIFFVSNLINYYQRPSNKEKDVKNDNAVFVVIFRATISSLDEEYSKTAAMLREIALSQFGCLEFHAVSEGEKEVALSYWNDLRSIYAWKQHADHLAAQKLGRERWYSHYRVEVTQILYNYGKK